MRRKFHPASTNPPSAARSVSRKRKGMEDFLEHAADLIEKRLVPASFTKQLWIY